MFNPELEVPSFFWGACPTLISEGYSLENAPGDIPERLNTLRGLYRGGAVIAVRHRDAFTLWIGINDGFDQNRRNQRWIEDILKKNGYVALPNSKNILMKTGNRDLLAYEFVCSLLHGVDPLEETASLFEQGGADRESFLIEEICRRLATTPDQGGPSTTGIMILVAPEESLFEELDSPSATIMKGLDSRDKPN